MCQTLCSGFIGNGNIGMIIWSWVMTLKRSHLFLPGMTSKRNFPPSSPLVGCSVTLFPGKKMAPCGKEEQNRTDFSLVIADFCRIIWRLSCQQGLARRWCVKPPPGDGSAWWSSALKTSGKLAVMSAENHLLSPSTMTHHLCDAEGQRFSAFNSRSISISFFFQSQPLNNLNVDTSVNALFKEDWSNHWLGPEGPFLGSC